MGMFFIYYKHRILKGMILNPYPWLGYDILPNLKFLVLGYDKFIQILV